MVGITNKIMMAEIRRQQALSKSIIDGQTAVSTGITLNRPSDNPLAWVHVSDIGRAQAQQAAWQANVSEGQTRGTAAQDNLAEINTLLLRSQELLTSARNGITAEGGKTAILAELTTVRTTINELMNQKDYQGVPVFDEQQTLLMPVSRGLNLAVVGTRQQVSEGIDVDGTPMSLDDILAQGLAALESGTDVEIGAALDATRAGFDHIVIEQAKQGVRLDRLDVIATRLTDTDLDLTERRADLESADLTEVIANLKAQLLQLDAAQSVFARINQQTLFDLIR